MQRSSSIFVERLFDTRLIFVSSVPYTAAGLAILKKFRVSSSCFSICSPPSLHMSVFSLYYRFFHQSFILDSLGTFSNGRRSRGGSLCLAAGSIACSTLGAASPGVLLSPVSCLACFDAIFCLVSPVSLLCYLVGWWWEQGDVRGEMVAGTGSVSNMQPCRVALGMWRGGKSVLLFVCLGFLFVLFSFVLLFVA